MIALLLYLALASSAQSVPTTLRWNANAEPDIAGYRVYYGTGSHVYTRHIDVGNSTAAIISDLLAGTLYYFATTAYNAFGVESNFSTELAYLAPSSTPTPTPGPTPLSVTIYGAVSYCSNAVANPVPNVILSLTGTATGSAVSDGLGNYPCHRYHTSPWWAYFIYVSRAIPGHGWNKRPG